MTLYKAVWYYLLKPLPYQPNILYFRLYRCRAYTYIKLQNKLDWLDPRAEIGYLVGYNTSNIYRVWVPDRNRVICVQDIQFDKSKFWDFYKFERKPDLVQNFISLPVIETLSTDVYNNNYKEPVDLATVDLQLLQAQEVNNRTTGQEEPVQASNLLQPVEKDLVLYKDT